SKIDRASLDKAKVGYTSYNPLDLRVHVVWEILPAIYRNSAACDDVIYEVAVTATEIEDTIIRRNQLREMKTP
ncbi:MAG TPA: hypothetical protein VHT68_16800, partial [Pseudolabrys sp.]|nr:hypothetical protein [Pseudolabrys sp.]